MGFDVWDKVPNKTVFFGTFPNGIDGIDKTVGFGSTTEMELKVQY